MPDCVVMHRPAGISRGERAEGKTRGAAPGRRGRQVHEAGLEETAKSGPDGPAPMGAASGTCAARADRVPFVAAGAPGWSTRL